MQQVHRVGLAVARPRLVVQPVERAGGCPNRCPRPQSRRTSALPSATARRRRPARRLSGAASRPRPPPSYVSCCTRRRPDRDGAGNSTRRWRRGLHAAAASPTPSVDARPRGWAATAPTAMVPQTPSRYYQASPAPERAPRAKNGQAAVPDIFELSGLAVCFAATRAPWDPSRALVESRKTRRAYFCIDKTR